MKLLSFCKVLNLNNLMPMVISFFILLISSLAAMEERSIKLFFFLFLLYHFLFAPAICSVAAIRSMGQLLGKQSFLAASIVQMLSVAIPFLQRFEDCLDLNWAMVITLFCVIQLITLLMIIKPVKRGCVPVFVMILLANLLQTIFYLLLPG